MKNFTQTTAMNLQFTHHTFGPNNDASLFLHAAISKVPAFLETIDHPEWSDALGKYVKTKSEQPHGTYRYLHPYDLRLQIPQQEIDNDITQYASKRVQAYIVSIA